MASACCAKFQSAVTRQEQAVAQIARKMAFAASRGRDFSGLRAQLDREKVALTQTRQMAVDHEADHAGVAV